MVKKIIALDIDQFRIGVYGPNYEEIFSSMYSEVKKNTWKPSFFYGDAKGAEGSQIKLEGSSDTIFWGIKKRQSRRSKAYHSFGDVLDKLDNMETVQLVRSALAYLASNQCDLFEEIKGNQLRCSVCIGVGSKSSNELKEIEHKFVGEYSALVDGVELSIIVDEVVLVPKSFCSILQDEREHFENEKSKIQPFDGLNYIIDVSDHYVKCDIYDNGELIKSENISHGIYEFSDRIVQEYKTNCVQTNQRAFQIDRDMVYNMITNDENILVVNGRQQIDLATVINEEIAEETKKVLSYLTKDNDVQYADNIIIRDLKSGIINQSTVNQYLESFGLYCMSIDNKSAKDIYTFGTIFLGDNFLGSNANAKETHSENVLPTFSSELVEENREAETKSSATMEVEMENANDSNGQLATSGPEDEIATVDEVTQADHLVETSDEVEIEDILKEQNELLSSLVGFEADSL